MMAVDRRLRAMLRTGAIGLAMAMGFMTTGAGAQRIAGAMLGVVESGARRAGASGILLHTARENVSARRAYVRAGYRVVSTTRGPWRGPNGIDGYVAMLRALR